MPKKFLKRIGFLLAALAMLLLSGCSSLVDQEQPQVNSEAKVVLKSNHPIGQTFVAHHAGLDGIELWLDPQPGSQGEIQLHLMADSQASTDMAKATLPLSQISSPGFYRFSFSPLRDSHSSYYYSFLELKGSGSISIGTAPGDTYLDGALYLDHQPTDAQASFRLTYAPSYLLLDMGQAAVGGLGMLIATFLLYVIPGWALLVLTRAKWNVPSPLHWAEWLGISIGISLALYPLALLWSDVVGLHLGALYAWLPSVLGLGVLSWHYRPWRWRPSQIIEATKDWIRSQTFWPDTALLLIIVLAAGGRLLAVRGLDMPLWDDSVQHTVIVKRILESGGLFQSWQPYAPYNTLSFQFGFHANVAVWGWLTGLDAPQAVIWAGQILNLLAMLTLYPLAHRIGGAWGGSIAVLAVGLLSRFPAYYTNWGRYPQMCGQAILPIAAWWLWATLQNHPSTKENRIVSIIGGACLFAGLALTYYRMMFHYLAFTVTAFLVLLRPFQPTTGWRKRAALVILPIIIVTIAAVLLFPWFYRTLIRYENAGRPTMPFGQERVAGKLWVRYEAMHVQWSLPRITVLLLGVLMTMWVGGNAALPLVWLLALALLPTLRLTSIPILQLLIQDFTIETSLYIPIALIWSSLGNLDKKIPIKRHLWPALFTLILVSLAMWKAPSLLQIIDRDYDLSTRPDIRAAEWIEQSLPADAFFLHNGIIYTDGYSAVGGDGGWWLPILTRRGVVIPPQYALHGEQPEQSGYSNEVNHLVQKLFEHSPISLEGKEAICNFSQPITHVYLGQRRGLVSKPIYPPPHPMLPADQLLQNPAFDLIYHQDRVMIFEFDRGVCK